MTNNVLIFGTNTDRKFPKAYLNTEVLPKTNTIAANTLSAVYYPEGINGASLSATILENNVILVGGLLPEIKTSYFRIGHMGSVSSIDLIAVLSALERALIELGHPIESGKAYKLFKTGS